MRKGVIAAVILVTGWLSQISQPVFASPSLQMQPLQYEESLQKGERKKGFVDVTNPQPVPVKIKLSVKGFKQIDDKGNLVFFDDRRLSDGVILDLHDAQIPAHKTLRLYFVIDGTKLPTGDVLAAIFAQTDNTSAPSGEPSVRLGSLLIIVNDTPGARQAEITRLHVPWLQWGDVISGQFAIKNTAPAASSNGFFPDVTISTSPYGPTTTTIHGPLIYTGNTRIVPFSLPSSQLGITKVSIAFGASRQEVWTLVITGVWRWVVVAIGLGVMGAGAALVIRLSRRRKHK